MFVRLAEGHRLIRALSGLALAGALALGAMGSTALAAPKTNADPSSPVTIDITQPAAHNGIAEGPVGANIAVAGVATPGDSITIGVAKRADGCTNGFQPLNGVTATAHGDGSFTASFPWPQIASNVGDYYNVCALDTTSNAVGASQTPYRVDSSDAPSITVAQVNDPSAPTPGAGTPTPQPPNPPEGTFYTGGTGGFVEVKGRNFFPGGIQIQILLTQSQLTPTTAALPPLQLASGAAITGPDGTFDVVAQLPPNQTGSFYLSATSSDGTGSVLPTLVGSESAQLALQPTPTPSPTATTAPKATATPITGGTNVKKGRSLGPLHIVGAIALGLFSAIFFIIGVAMLISASGMSGAPTRPQPR